MMTTTPRPRSGSITRSLHGRESGTSSRAHVHEHAHTLPAAAPRLAHLGTLQYNPSVAPPHPSFAVHFKPGATLLAVCDEGGYMAVVDVAAGMQQQQPQPAAPAPAQQPPPPPQPAMRVLQLTKAHTNAVFDIAWSRNGAAIATAGADHLVRVFDPSSLTALLELKSHTATVKAVRFARTSSAMLASTSRDGFAYIWDTRASCDKPVMEFRRAHTVSGASSPAPSNSSVTCAEFTFDDRILVTGGAADSCVKLWDTRKLITPQTRAASQQLPLPLLTLTNGDRSRGGVSALDISPRDGSIMALRTDGIVTVYPGTGVEGYERQYHRGATTSYFIKAAFAHEGRLIVSGSCSREILVWDTYNPQQQREPLRDSQHFGEVTGVASTMVDGQTLIASCGDDSLINAWVVQ